MVIWRNAIPVVLVTTTTLSALALTQPSTLANSDVVTTTTVNIAESCNLRATTDTAHTATIIGGTYSGTNYANGIGQTTLKAFCNDSAGFAIYAIGFTNDEYGNNKLHWSGASSASDDTNAISTGIYTSGTTVNSTWSMKLAAVSGTYAATIDDGVAAHNDSTENFTTWHTVPTEYKRVAYRLSGTDTEQQGGNSIGSSITTTYDAYISATQPAGAYVGQVKYTLVHPSSEGAPEIPVTIDNIVYMQDLANITPTQYQMFKDSMTEDQQYQLIDIRDNKTYYLAKLKDGNVWMTQNLDLDLVTDGSIIYDNTTTDLGWNSTTGTYGTASWVPSCTVLDFGRWDSGSESWEAYEERVTESCPEYYDQQNYFVPRFWQNGDLYWDGPGTTSASSSGNAHYHVGNNYNWTAAIAMNNSVNVEEGTLVEQSICPAGWTLPRVNTYTWWDDEEDEYAGGDGSFDALLVAYDLGNGQSFVAANDQYSLWTAPLYLSYERTNRAVVGSGQYIELSSGTSHWLSMATPNWEGEMAYSFGAFDGENPRVQPSFYGSGRQNDYPVRCIVRDPEFTWPEEDDGE